MPRSAPPAPPAPPTPAEVRAIADTADPVLRNHRITLGYHRLAVALSGRLGTGGEGNWCAFAVWASRQAGRTIRGEDLRLAVQRALQVSSGTLRALEGVVAAARPLGSRRTVGELRQEIVRALDLDAVAGRASGAVARGNRIVFEEVGSAVAGFLAAGASGGSGGVSSGMDAAGLRAGLGPPQGAHYLRHCLHRYDLRRAETGAARRAELLFLGNVEIGYHEQIRIQPEIEDAVHAALPDPDQLRQRIFALLFPGGNAWIRARTRFWALVGRPSPLDLALERLVAEVRRPVREAITLHMMRLELPGGLDLRLGRDLTGAFPETLRELTHPDLLGLLARIDPTPDSLSKTAVRDWADLGQRVHYIVDLFRCHQETPGLLTPPYAPAEAGRIMAGQSPDDRRH
ncbi:MAG: hypothetical protein EA350_01205 [Gemmatimonadales bacterium]|nr:MAG: hypothetical protein EA350_01205 [Gemmatimonadales bacterium]